jgi:hypothetical protein
MHMGTADYWVLVLCVHAPARARLQPSGMARRRCVGAGSDGIVPFGVVLEARPVVAPGTRVQGLQEESSAPYTPSCAAASQHHKTQARSSWLINAPLKKNPRMYTDLFKAILLVYKLMINRTV